MMKLVVLTLCLFAAAAYASPAAFEEEAVPENYPLPLSVPVEGASLPMGAARMHQQPVPVAVPRARLAARRLPRQEHLLLLALKFFRFHEKNTHAAFSSYELTINTLRLKSYSVLL
ncbi:hypothetical protein EVAR_50450_1 [Eumeta japonica]|uniref:Uncharacterized protein n=1 Tax=Eumeta variegata TaxID=151549 RepID=A0A4C1XWV4_EUMVA|nr:hypothetical protein EVAR_50450_1 [Eumeta japonica]